VRHLTYLLLLAVCLLATLPLELLLDARVYRRWRRSVLAIAPVALVFIVWDLLAIRARWWTFDRSYVTGIDLPGRLPIEELLFFLVVPVCALLTFEAVRRLRPSWAVSGREPARRR
jgi:lycopene cyclase domain-containing protein